MFADGDGVRAQHAAPLPHTPGLRPGSVTTLGIRQFAEVVLPLPVPRPYTYEIPGELAHRVVPGARVVVPVQRRQVVGVVTAVAVAAPAVTAKAIVGAPDEEPALAGPLLELGRWISRYYGTPPGWALRALLPGALWSVQRDRKSTRLNSSHRT